MSWNFFGCGVFFFHFLLLFCFVFFTVFLSYIPKETSKYKGKKAILRTRMKAKQKSRGKKNTERRLKESIGGPAELSSRGLGFLQRKLRYMFVCLHFQIGAVGAHSEENKSNANFWGGHQYSRLLTGPPGYWSSPLPAVLTCLNINNKGEGRNVSIKHQDCLSRKMDSFQDTMQAVASPDFWSSLPNPLNVNLC